MPKIDLGRLSYDRGVDNDRIVPAKRNCSAEFVWVGVADGSPGGLVAVGCGVGLAFGVLVGRGVLVGFGVLVGLGVIAWINPNSPAAYPFGPAVK